MKKEGQDQFSFFDVIAFLLGLHSFNPKLKDTPNRKASLLIYEFLRREEIRKQKRKDRLS